MFSFALSAGSATSQLTLKITKDPGLGHLTKSQNICEGSTPGCFSLHFSWLYHFTDEFEKQKMKNPGLEPALPTAKADAKVQLPNVSHCLFSWFCHCTAEFEMKKKNPRIESISPTAKAEVRVQIQDVLFRLFNWFCHFPAEFEKNEKSGT